MPKTTLTERTEHLERDTAEIKAMLQTITQNLAGSVQSDPEPITEPAQEPREPVVRAHKVAKDAEAYLLAEIPRHLAWANQQIEGKKGPDGEQKRFKWVRTNLPPMNTREPSLRSQFEADSGANFDRTAKALAAAGKLETKTRNDGAIWAVRLPSEPTAQRKPSGRKHDRTSELFRQFRA